MTSFSGNFHFDHLGIDSDGVAGGAISGVTPASDIQMKLQATFTNWDFTNIWIMAPAGYPILRGLPTL